MCPCFVTGIDYNSNLMSPMFEVLASKIGEISGFILGKG